MTAPDSETRSKRHAPIVFTGNVFAVIDDGRALPEEYVAAEKLILAETLNYPGGLGCIVVIPAGAKPPPEAQRKAIDGVLTRLSSQLRGLAWVVEGAGFGAAAVRGVLIGLSLYGRRSYPTHVCTSVHDALGWLATRLGTSSDTKTIDRAADRIATTRAEYRALRA